MFGGLYRCFYRSHDLSKLVKGIQKREFSSRRFMRQPKLKEATRQKEPLPPRDTPINPRGEKLRPASHLWRALLFAGGTGAVCFTWAAIKEFQNGTRTHEDWVRRMNEEVERLIKELTSPTPDRHRLRDLTPGEKIILSIIGINVAVWMLWKVPALQPRLWTYFVNSFSTRPFVLSMMFSVYSHQSFLHLFFNMYVLQSFGSATIDRFLGAPQFLAFYVTSGVVASLVSVAHKCLIGSAVPALGASGAILALVIYVCMKMPEARLGIIFIPGWDFSAKNAAYGILLFDLIGLIAGSLTAYRFMDHAAHLGGALFGLLYALYGEELYRTKLQPYVYRALSKENKRRIEEGRQKRKERGDSW